MNPTPTTPDPGVLAWVQATLDSLQLPTHPERVRRVATHLQRTGQLVRPLMDLALPDDAEVQGLSGPAAAQGDWT